MRVLIACEFSGIVREAFRARGHDAWSCDLLPTEIPGNHIEGDVLQVLGDGWDLMIAHPPCTFLSYAGVAHWNKPGRAEEREVAYEFFLQLWNAPIFRIAVENPVGYPNTVFRKPDQIIHPYYFGDDAVKKTCLWLKNLPCLWWWNQPVSLFPATGVEKPAPLYVHERKPSKNYRGGEIKNRYFIDHTGSNSGHERSRTFPGIAGAMAAQWG